MPRIRRATGLLVGFLMLHLSFVEAGFTCTEPGPSTAPMPGMAMGTTDELGRTGTVGETHASQRDHENPQRGQSTGNCEFPWAPGGCQSMVPCAPATLGVTSAVDAQLPSPNGSMIRFEVTTPPSLSRPPELPPPRA